jgi:hypothetical protein
VFVISQQASATAWNNALVYTAAASATSYSYTVQASANAWNNAIVYTSAASANSYTQIINSIQSGTIQLSGNYVDLYTAQNIDGNKTFNGYTTVNNTLKSSKYILGADLSLIPIAGNQSAISTWWGLQLNGNRQSSVDYNPTNIGVNGDHAVLIPSPRTTKTVLGIFGTAGQIGNLTNWYDDTTSLNVVAAISPNGTISGSNIVITILPTTTGNFITYDSTKKLIDSGVSQSSINTQVFSTSATVYAISIQASATAWNNSRVYTAAASATSYAYTTQASATVFSITMQASANALSQALNGSSSSAGASANAYIQTVNLLQPQIINISGAFDKTLTYDINNNLSSITTIKGTKTFNYDGSGNLISISGTGIYPTKSFIYTDGQLTQILII